MDSIEGLRLLALHEVVNSRRASPKLGDPDYPLRKIFRVYSERFHTPLDRVEALPLDEVLRHYFESTFENLDEEALEKAVATAVEDPEALRREQRIEDAMDYESYLDAKAIAAEEAVKKIKEATKALQTPPEPTVGRQEKFSRPTIADRREAELAPKAPPPAPIPEGFTVQFDDSPDDDETPSVGFGLFGPESDSK